ncbi:glycolate oxidase iron-sulfur subunit [Microbulbifer agarilyticus]|uniref:Glycolate oxidase iron-sulfur subunit n=1 Tax=Microbulbifer agarilyticus TaxID=260552 RepID=A0A1Q2M3G8_9GAMM|nr:glycolate oxidase subunit GlcF [Microbulbifer agarilyticus]AQQ67274.1 glycolate oxidase iron-sulfur subunit [Microbulbifer agarilyticus]
MQVNLIDGLLQEGEKQRAEQVLNACVHCGFCTATCPTYLQQGNELDSPRGRIYLVKEMLERGEATKATRQHLDRCLTCLSCETTCPSGVEYHKLVAIGRHTIERLAPRGKLDIFVRWGLRKLMVTRGLFAGFLRVGRLFSGLLPATIRRVYFPVVPRFDVKAALDSAAAPRSLLQKGTVLIVRGCVQPALRPQTDLAMSKILNYFGVPIAESTFASCCGAASFHTSGEEEARRLARTNIDGWWKLNQGVDGPVLRAIISTASGCGVHLKDYPHLLQDDEEYREKAVQLASLVKDPVELLEELFSESTPTLSSVAQEQRLAFHCPCTLQHGQGLNQRVEQLLGHLGIRLPQIADSHLCCGSAGTYSVLQPSMSKLLRGQKLTQLLATDPDTVITANIGCQLHLQSGTEKPVRHWLEVVADALSPPTNVKNVREACNR